MKWLKDYLYRLFVNYNHGVITRWCGCKTCNYDGIYEGLTCEGKANNLP